MNEPLDDPKVTAAHRALRETPPPALDARILAAATQAVADDAAQRATHARWRRWAPAVGVAATAVLGLALSLQLLYTPQTAKPEEATGPAELLKERSSLPAAATPEPAAAPVVVQPMATETRKELDLPKIDVPLEDGRPLGAVAGGSAYTPAVASPAPPAAERAAAAEVMRQEIAADAAPRLDRVEATGSRIKRTQAEGYAAPEPAESWRKRIVELRTAGKTEDSERELRAFCVAYPDEAECKKP